jgi:hypothetical protein
MGNSELNISKNNEGNYDNKSMGYEKFNNESKKSARRHLAFTRCNYEANITSMFVALNLPDIVTVSTFHKITPPGLLCPLFQIICHFFGQVCFGKAYGAKQFETRG